MQKVIFFVSELAEEIYEEWDDLTPGDKLVFKTPIPLNSEQRQILSALNKNNCNYEIFPNSKV